MMIFNSKKINKIILKYLFIFIALFDIVFTTVIAQDSTIKYKLSTGAQEIGNRSTAGGCIVGYFCIGGDSAANFLQSAFNLAVGISITVAVVLLILNGVDGVLKSFGVKDANVKISKDYDSTWYNPIVGLIIVLISVVVVRTLNPDLLEFPIFNSLNLEVNGGQNTGTIISPATVE